MPKRRGYTHYQSKRRYADAYQSRNYGEIELNFGETAALGDGAAALGTAEIAGAGASTFFRIASGDEVDALCRIPADFDATATSHVYLYYTLASSSIATNDTITPLVAYQIPVPGTNASGLGDAASSEGVTNHGSITLGTAAAVGSVYLASATLSSAATLAAGSFVHFNVETKTTCATDKECRVLTKGVLKYAKDYL